MRVQIFFWGPGPGGGGEIFLNTSLIGVGGAWSIRAPFDSYVDNFVVFVSQLFSFLVAGLDERTQLSLEKFEDVEIWPFLYLLCLCKQSPE